MEIEGLLEANDITKEIVETVKLQIKFLNEANEKASSGEGGEESENKTNQREST
jgi:hypothetical protein